MHKLINKYELGNTLGTYTKSINTLKGIIDKQKDINYASTTGQNDTSKGISNIISSILHNYKKNKVVGTEGDETDVDEDDEKKSLTNEVLGVLGAELGYGLGSQINEGKYANEFKDLTTILGENLVKNGNFKDLFKGGSGQAMGAVGYNLLNKSMNGDKNKDFVSRALTDYGSLAWTVSPTVGAITTGVMALNNLTRTKTDRYEGNTLWSQEAQAALGGSYEKTISDLQRAEESEGNYGGIARITGEASRAKRRVNNGNMKVRDLQDVYDTANLGKIRGRYMHDLNSYGYNLDVFGGYNQGTTQIGKSGMKLPNKTDRIQNILAMKKGGQMSVIPEGALHARLHHLETENKITRKGIPVVDKQGEQQAEIERNEIIFSLEVTNKLEALRKDGSDRAALEAGKLLVDEIFNNTDDRTGLIAEVTGETEAKKPVFKEGGIIAEMPGYSIEAEEPTNEEDDEIEYLQEGGIIAEMPDGFDNEEEEVEEYQEGGKTEQNVPNFLTYDKELDKYILNLQYTYDKNWYDSPEAKWFRKKYIKDEWKDDKGQYHLEFPNKKDYKPRNLPNNNVRAINIPDITGEGFTKILQHNGLPARKTGMTDDGGTIYTDIEGNENIYYEKQGGIIEQLNKLSPDKLRELETILKYLNHD